MVTKFWIIKWEPNTVEVKDAMHSMGIKDTSLFRVFTKFGYLLTSCQRGRHVCWKSEFQVLYIDAELRVIRDVTDMVKLESFTHCASQEELEADEPNSMPQFSQ